MANRKSNNLNMNDLKSNTKREEYNARRQNRRISGQRVNTSTSPEFTRILSATQRLSKNGTANPKGNSGATPNDYALNLLSAMGCSIESGKGKDYSLKNDTTDTATISNPNIVDEARKGKKKQMKGASGKFKNSNDPFYNLDGNVPEQASAQEKRRKEIKMTPNVVKVASDLAVLNMAPGPNTLKEFK